MLRLPPEKGDVGILAADVSAGRSVEVLEVVDDTNAIIRAWYRDEISGELTFTDLWLRGIDTKQLTARKVMRLPQTFQVAGNQLIDTTCGKRSFVALEPK